jgi:hypothetical protein
LKRIENIGKQDDVNLGDLFIIRKLIVLTDKII